MGVRPGMMRLVIFVASAAAILIPGKPAFADDERNGFRYRLPGDPEVTGRWKHALPLYGGLVSGSASGATGSRLGTAFGFGVETWKGHRDWSFEVGLLVATKGFSESAGTVMLRYLEIPVLIRRTFWKHFSLTAGIFAAPVVLAATRSQGGVAVDVDDEFRGDYGLVFGARYSRRIMTKLRLGLDARYDWGLFSVRKSGAPTKPGSLLLMAVLEFGLW